MAKRIMLNNFDVLARQRFIDDGEEFSIRAISRKTGLDRRTITAYLRNEVKRPDSSVVLTLCQWLGVTTKEFWQDEFKVVVEDDADPEFITLLTA